VNAEGAYSAPPYPLAAFERSTSREREGGEREERAGEGRGKEEKG